MYEIFEALMKSRGLTHYKVSKETVVDQATLSRWKNNKSTPSLETLQTLADFFGVSLDYIRGREQIKKAPTALSEDKQEYIEVFEELTPEFRKVIIDSAKALRDLNRKLEQ